ncbi:rhodanese-like domain-containing protein [Peribacillus frigoritolerans]|uniref:rhodanese-like domain-containing protein n=1 Tax=Peribacillus frigoritolerans TaxID=450367 RepID=UPI00105A729A|nr:rhodanese-like domain-containing protein [Peribacillus frigoritolerans]TDL78844.1 rhodanese-like domain-containing protein [Peribacillus frigoritolerans]
MEIVNYILIGLLLLFIIKRFIPAKGIKSISVEQLKIELKNRNKQLIDVRTPEEFKGNHLKGFTNIPIHQLTQKANQLSKDKEVIVICQSGMRSQKASKTLKKLGFKEVTNVKGGMNAWS